MVPFLKFNCFILIKNKRKYLEESTLVYVKARPCSCIGQLKAIDDLSRGRIYSGWLSYQAISSFCQACQAICRGISPDRSGQRRNFWRLGHLESCLAAQLIIIDEWQLHRPIQNLRTSQEHHRNPPLQLWVPTYRYKDIQSSQCRFSFKLIIIT